MEKKNFKVSSPVNKGAKIQYATVEWRWPISQKVVTSPTSTRQTTSGPWSARVHVLLHPSPFISQLSSRSVNHRQPNKKYRKSFEKLNRNKNNNNKKVIRLFPTPWVLFGQKNAFFLSNWSLFCHFWLIFFF